MHFRNSEHENLFREYQVRVDAGNNREYTSALYLLAATGKPLGKFIRRWDINIKGIQAASRVWSSGEKALVKLAVNIFCDCGKANVNEIFKQLDSENVRVALEALAMRYQRRAVYGVPQLR